MIMPCGPEVNEGCGVANFKPTSGKLVQLFIDTTSAERLCERKTSQREMARSARIPFSTFQKETSRYTKLKAESPSAEFFMSEAGEAFLHRLLLVLQLLFVQTGLVGASVISRFLELMELDRFVAASETHWKNVKNDVQELITKYGEQEESASIPASIDPDDMIESHLILDETFYDKYPWLVAMDSRSGFLLCETQADKCTISAWTTALTPRIKKLGIRVTEATSDRGSAVVSFTQNVLGVHSAPDVFHVQRELGRGTLRYIGSMISKSKERLVKATSKVKNDEEHAVVNDNMRSLQDKIKTLETAIDEITAKSRAFSNSYHFVCLASGSLRKPDLVERELRNTIDDIERIVNLCEVPKSLQDGLKKARNAIPQMAATIDFCWSYMDDVFSQSDCTSYEKFIIREYLLPYNYLQCFSSKRPSDEKKRILAEADRINNIAESKLADLEPERLSLLKSIAIKIAQIFERSSSAVEGRNGQLSLRHHALHNISERSLNVLTILHNYFIERDDGTTAAERFFGKKPSSLLEYLIKNAPLPAKPRARSKSEPAARAAAG